MIFLLVPGGVEDGDVVRGAERDRFRPNREKPGFLLVGDNDLVVDDSIPKKVWSAQRCLFRLSGVFVEGG